MDVSSLRLDTLNIRVEPCKQFTPPDWAVPGNAADTGSALHVIKNGEVIDTLKIDDHRLYTLFGRCPTSVDSKGICVTLEHPSVSRLHAAVLRGKENLVYVIDLGSSHGTYVSGKRIEPFMAVPLHNRSVVVFGQSTRRYIVRVFPKTLVGCQDPEEANTLRNCMVSYKEQSPQGSAGGGGGRSLVVPMEEEAPPKLERRVSFSCLAPEIIPALPSRPTPPSHDGPTTPIAVMGGSPEVSWFRKSIMTSPRAALPEMMLASSSSSRAKSDSLPSLQANSGSEEDDENASSMDSLELSPTLTTIDEMREVIPVDGLLAPVAVSTPSARKSFFKRAHFRLGEALVKKMRPESSSSS